MRVNDEDLKVLHELDGLPAVDLRYASTVIQDVVKELLALRKVAEAANDYCGRGDSEEFIELGLALTEAGY